MRTSCLAAAAVVLSLLIFPTPCPAADAPEAGVATVDSYGIPSSRVYGYRHESDDVVFVFSPDVFSVATRGDNGRPVAVDRIDIGTVAVAGEFNDWSRDAWIMAEEPEGVYVFRWPMEELKRQRPEGERSWQFKFVIDGFYWIEPPADATNAPPTGYSNASRNLLLRLDRSDPVPLERVTGEPIERGKPAESVESRGRVEAGDPASEFPLLAALTLPEAAQSGGCRLKSVSAAYGAPVGPARVNPMIATDRAAIAFVAAFIAPPTEDDFAGPEASTGHTGPDAMKQQMEAWLEKRMPGVVAAYTCVYRSESPADETGVYALRFEGSVPKEVRTRLETFAPEEAILVGESVAGIIWTDGPGNGCLETVRAHVRSVLAD